MPSFLTSSALLTISSNRTSKLSMLLLLLLASLNTWAAGDVDKIVEMSHETLLGKS